MGFIDDDRRTNTFGLWQSFVHGFFQAASVLTRWEWHLKKPGDSVAADEPIASIETDKVSVEVPSPVAGTLSETLVNEGDAPVVLTGASAEGVALRGAGLHPVPRTRLTHLLMISDNGIDTMFDKDERRNSGWDVAASALAAGPSLMRGGLGSLRLALPVSALAALVAAMAVVVLALVDSGTLAIVEGGKDPDDVLRAEAERRGWPVISLRG